MYAMISTAVQQKEIYLLFSLHNMKAIEIFHVWVASSSEIEGGGNELTWFSQPINRP
jgi:hypothetical protein